MAAEERFEGHVEELDVHLPDIVAHPFLEDIDEKSAVLLRADRALSDQIARLRVEQTFAARMRTPALVGKLQRLLGGSLDDGDELQPLGTQLVAEEPVTLRPCF